MGIVAAVAGQNIEAFSTESGVGKACSVGGYAHKTTFSPIIISGITAQSFAGSAPYDLTTLTTHSIGNAMGLEIWGSSTSGNDSIGFRLVWCDSSGNVRYASVGYSLSVTNATGPGGLYVPDGPDVDVIAQSHTKVAVWITAAPAGTWSLTLQPY